jgi:hypothetical protein
MMAGSRETGPWIASPYLHLYDHEIVNPHTGRSIAAADPTYSTLCRFYRSRETIENLDTTSRPLADAGWLIPRDKDLSQKYRLRYVSLETHTVCTQACAFCPVSIAPRKPDFIAKELFDRLAEELSLYRESIEAVMLNNYNEPTADRRFVEQVRTLMGHGLPVAVLSNASTFTPEKVDALVEMGPISYMSVNISTLDRERYAAERQRDHLPRVLEHLDYMKDKEVAETMDIVVLGHQDETHRSDAASLRDYFAGSRFNVRDFEIMDRAGYLPFGIKPETPHDCLRGCNNLGSRPIEHIHINPRGQCVLCCEDYDEHHIVGDLTRQSIDEVMSGPELARLRRMIYGIDEAGPDFICRKCAFAFPGE